MDTCKERIGRGLVYTVDARIMNIAMSRMHCMERGQKKEEEGGGDEEEGGEGEEKGYSDRTRTPPRLFRLFIINHNPSPNLTISSPTQSFGEKKKKGHLHSGRGGGKCNTNNHSF